MRGWKKIKATDEKSRDKEKHGRRRRVITSPCRWSPTAMGWSPAAPPAKDGQSPSLLAPAYVTRQRSAVSVLRLPAREVPAVTRHSAFFFFNLLTRSLSLLCFFYPCAVIHSSSSVLPILALLTDFSERTRMQFILRLSPLTLTPILAGAMSL